MSSPDMRAKAVTNPLRPTVRRLGRTLMRTAARGSLSMTLVVTMIPPAQADGGGRCGQRTFYKIHSLSPRNFFIPRTRYIDGPGGTITVTVTREYEVRAFRETENEEQVVITTGDLVRNLRKMGVPHLEERHMVFTGHEYSRTISKGMYGNMWYRVFGYRIGWSAWSVIGTCRHVRVASGIANVPSRVEGWRYWETKHPTFQGRTLSLDGADPGPGAGSGSGRPRWRGPTSATPLTRPTLPRKAPTTERTKQRRR
ncbi:MAG: hypothetical protein HOV96_34850 [Nonomuraea sp.]|nr:hypothetical protein [Nonomuraea sp.]NUP65654.1 hypothetical protein [Nonomuraea sp.]NUP82731.1 hypothetical protein [Nonomuraea sp.]